MGDTSGCQISSNNLAVYIQGVTVIPSSNITSEYFVTASLPSSASLRRVWQFTTQGTITGPDTATLTLDYTQAHINCPEYNITFEGALNGTLIVKNQVFSAKKFMSYTLTSTYVLELTIKIPKAILECFGATTTQNYFFDVSLNDAASTSGGTSLSCNYSSSGWDVSGNVTQNQNEYCSGTCGTEQYKISENSLYISLDVSGSPYTIYPTATEQCSFTVNSCSNDCSSKCIVINVQNVYGYTNNVYTNTKLCTFDTYPYATFTYSTSGDSSGYFVYP
jgi:hypothetical protein